MDSERQFEVDKKFQKELNAGTGALLLLSTLKKSGKPLYGYQIAKLIEGSHEKGQVIKLGTLYPVLRSLEDNRLLSSEVEPSVSGPPRRYYQITEEGKKTLKRWIGIWSYTKDFLDKTIMEGK